MDCRSDANSLPKPRSYVVSKNPHATVCPRIAPSAFVWEFSPLSCCFYRLSRSTIRTIFLTFRGLDSEVKRIEPEAIGCNAIDDPRLKGFDWIVWIKAFVRNRSYINNERLTRIRVRSKPYIWVGAATKIHLVANIAQFAQSVDYYNFPFRR